MAAATVTASMRRVRRSPILRARVRTEHAIGDWRARGARACWPAVQQRASNRAQKSLPAISMSKRGSVWNFTTRAGGAARRGCARCRHCRTRHECRLPTGLYRAVRNVLTGLGGGKPLVTAFNIDPTSMRSGYRVARSAASCRSAASGCLCHRQFVGPRVAGCTAGQYA